jgi:hypothetical protein
VLRRLPLPALLAAALLAIAIRLPLLGVPLDADEGGYAYLSRQWAAGGRLYGPVWVDRPQGLLLAYRLVTSLGTSRVYLHLAAIALAVLLLGAVAVCGRELGGTRAAVTGAVLVAVVGAAPRLQGFMFNGELAAGACSAWAVACALTYLRRRAFWLLPGAGACGGGALLMKQSGFDGLATALIIATVAWRVRGAASVLAGAAAPLGLAVLHAALNSWHDWWFAVVGYRLDTSAGSRGGLSGRWHNIAVSLPRLWPDLLALAVLAALGLGYCVARRSPFPLVWLTSALAGFLGGVFFFPHYWMQLVGPCCLLGALALSALRPRLAVAALVLACLPSLTWTARAITLDKDGRDRLAVPDQRLEANRAISPWLRAHAAPGDELYAFVSSADLYYTSGLPTRFRYLWQANLEAIPAAVGELRGYLAGPAHPQWVVLYARPDAVDPTGALGRILAAGYRRAAVIDGVPVLHSVPH